RDRSPGAMPAKGRRSTSARVAFQNLAVLIQVLAETFLEGRVGAERREVPVHPGTDHFRDVYPFDASDHRDLRSKVLGKSDGNRNRPSGRILTGHSAAP